MHERDKLYINGQWIAPCGRGSIEVVEASTEQVMGSIPEGDASDADAAVAAARAAFDAWNATAPAERAAYLGKIAEGLHDRSDDLARLIAAEVGMPLTRRLRTGQVDINGGNFNGLAPFGGYKQSGNGRELGSYGLDEFLEYKSLQCKPSRPA